MDAQQRPPRIQVLALLALGSALAAPVGAGDLPCDAQLPACRVDASDKPPQEPDCSYAPPVPIPRSHGGCSEGAMCTAQRQFYYDPPPAGYGIWGLQESDNDNARLLLNVVRWLDAARPRRRGRGSQPRAALRPARRPKKVASPMQVPLE